MAVTSVRLSDALKQAVGELAHIEGKTPHAFMLEAIEEKIEAARQRQEFIAQGLDALAQFESTGQAIGADDMHKWMRARASGKPATAPRARRRAS